MNAVAHFLPPKDARSVIDCASGMRPQSTEGWRRAAHRGKVSAQLAWLVATRGNLAPLASAGLFLQSSRTWRDNPSAASVISRIAATSFGVIGDIGGW